VRTRGKRVLGALLCGGYAEYAPPKCGRKISSVSGADREEYFVFQRLSVSSSLQRYNAVLLNENFAVS